MLFHVQRGHLLPRLRLSRALPHAECRRVSRCSARGALLPLLLLLLQRRTEALECWRVLQPARLESELLRAVCKNGFYAGSVCRHKQVYMMSGAAINITSYVAT